MLIMMINGYPQSGKTTFIEQTALGLKEADSPIQIKNISSIDCIKQLAKEKYGWDGIKTPESRAMLAKLKQENLDYVHKTLEDAVQKLIDENFYGILFIDVREPQEIRILQDIFFKKFRLGTVTLFIDRPQENRELSNDADKNVENFKYDITIHNTKTINELKEAGTLIATIMFDNLNDFFKE